MTSLRNHARQARPDRCFRRLVPAVAATAALLGAGPLGGTAMGAGGHTPPPRPAVASAPPNSAAVVPGGASEREPRPARVETT
jgi:hypothetical protein